MVYARKWIFYELLSTPNDSLYSQEQPNLHPTTAYPYAHINMESAWEIETGKSHVKVGVYDSGIKYTHEDFGDGTFAGSVIDGGKDYYNNSPGIPIQNLSNPDLGGHGTNVAGIIGAVTNLEFLG
ncbi:MAG: S8 family serine peptidase [Bacteroidia bacterium]